MDKLFRHQEEALRKLSNGNILVAGTGSGKSHVALSYFYERIVGGCVNPPTKPTKSVDIYIITTPKKRDDFDFQKLGSKYGLSTSRDSSINGILLTVDSWNNIHKYTSISDAFFIFDEQRAIGSGTWAKSFIKISKRNRWILLSATPADNWMDLIPVFIANGFYKNRTEFIREHVEYSPYTKYPKILRYRNEEKLRRLRGNVFVIMRYKKHTIGKVVDINVEYDKTLVSTIVKKQWNHITDKPIKNLQEHNHLIRRVVNSNESRIKAAKEIFRVCKKLIIFYNFNYELEILLESFLEITTVAQHNGHRHDSVPDTNEWVYLVQYMSGNEAWECFTTNHMLFYSLNYSYRITKQSMGRIDRLTTTYNELYYYRLISNSMVDYEILKAFREKKDFNDRGILFT